MVDDEGQPRPQARRAVRTLEALSPTQFSQYQSLAELSLYSQGVTFSVYSDRRGTEKIFPICLVPRVIGAAEWDRVEKGLAQRIAALCAFLDDMYGPQKILSSGVVPPDLLLGAKFFIPKLRGIKPPGGVRIPIAGIDLIRSPDGVFRVLEDNVRTPSGVSYVVENRLVTKRIFQGAVAESAVRPVEQYPSELAETLRAISPVDPAETHMVLLTPGSFNSAYFEHTFLARTMGVDLVEPGDLFVEDDTVFVRTTHGPKRIHVIYRRIDDAYLDPEFFRPDSLLGVPGLMRAYAAGRVALANAPGNGLADDKAVYPFVPDMIKYYLGENAILAQVDTLVCARPDDLAYVIENLHLLVVKAVDEAGGYGMLMGPQASAAERDDFRRRIIAEPRRYIAQHRIELSTCPTWDPATGQLAPRRVDLRPFVLTKPSGSWVLPRGLTRVALVAGSYVVNSSQGGGSKDTWVQKGARS
ncbi:MAG TPA: circularly permuted type 2 ATP-grasp protein [Polyangia bacterium]